jgi:hypothetical protein
MRPIRFPSLWYVGCKPCTYIALTLALPVPYEFHRVRLRWFSKPTVRLAQTTHLSCVKITNISKRTQTSFDLSLVT